MNGIEIRVGNAGNELTLKVCDLWLMLEDESFPPYNQTLIGYALKK